MKNIITLIFFIISYNVLAQQTIDKLNVNTLKLPKESVSRALYLNSSNQIKSSSTVSDTELGYLDGASSNIQTQLSDKASLTASESIAGTKTFTGKIIGSTTSNGFIPCPKMTQTQRDAIVSPVSGDCVYNTTTPAPSFYTGSAWVDLSALTTDTVKTPSASLPVIYSGRVASGGGVSVQIGNLFSGSCVYGTPIANSYNCPITSGKFSGTNYNCTGSANIGNVRYMNFSHSSTSTNAVFQQVNSNTSGAANDTAWTYVCHGVQ